MMNTLLTEILAAREQRARTQQKLLEQYRLPLVCFTMNIPGPEKDSPLIRRAFREGLSQLEETLDDIVFRQEAFAITGCEAFFVANMPAELLKAVCQQIEDTHPLGRLFDMDVLDLSGVKLERKNQRGCMVCGKPGRFCAASRAHSAPVLQQTVAAVMTDFFARQDGDAVANFAEKALLDEVHTTPKPGLVDENNQGSHKDMDIPLFTRSAESLRPYFLACFEIGRDHQDLSPEETFSLLRRAGIEAEKQMFAATGGVNTHKGAVFTMGLLCGSIGRLWQAGIPFAGTEAVLQEAASLAFAAVQADLSAIDTPTTPGEALFLKKGLTGIRGQAAAGFPAIRDISLPAFTQALARGNSQNDAAVIALIHLIAQVEDTNLYHRGGSEGAAFAKDAAKALLPNPDMADVAALDGQFIARNLSPGGCADLLAATLFLSALKNNFPA